MRSDSNLRRKFVSENFDNTDDRPNNIVWSVIFRLDRNFLGGMFVKPYVMKMLKLTADLIATFAICLSFVFAVQVEISAKTPRYAHTLLIENAMIISPGLKKIEVFKGHILVRDDVIVYVGKRKPVTRRNATRIDVRGNYVIPGLIDSHTHLTAIAGLSFKLGRKYPGFAKDYYRQMPKSYLYFGYTTLIDTNNHSPNLLESIFNKNIKPKIFTCGEQLEVMNGFMMAETKPEDRLKYNPHFLHDRYNKNVKVPANVPLKAHSVKASIQRIARRQNGKCVKIAFENGFGGTEEVTWEMPSKKIVRDIVDEAKKARIPVLLHANSFEAQQFALDTGVDIIAHGMWHWGLIKEYLQVKELPTTHKILLEKIASNQVGYQPTFRVIAGQRDVFDDNFLRDPNLKHVYPKPYLEWLETEEGHWQQNNIKKYAKGFFDGKTNSEIVPFMQLIVDKINISTKVLADNNANLLFGTDTPASNSHTNPPGYNGYLEMKEWFKAGVSLEQILRAATINNAKAFNLDKSYGSIEKGKVANLLVLTKNPLRDISAYNSIKQVVLNGRVLNRSDLSANND